MMNSRAVESFVIFGVECVAFCEKEFQRTRLRLLQKLTNIPGRVENDRWILVSTQRVINSSARLLQLDAGVMIWKMIKVSRGQHGRAAICIKREEPNSRHVIKVNISSN